MADDPTTVDSPQETPPATQPQTPAPQSTQPSHGPGPSSQDGPLQRLEQAIAGMPEAIANALAERSPRQPATPPRKSAPPAAQQSTQPTGGQSSASPATPAAVPGKKKSFADWWFGT